MKTNHEMFKTAPREQMSVFLEKSYVHRQKRRQNKSKLTKSKIKWWLLTLSNHVVKVPKIYY